MKIYGWDETGPLRGELMAVLVFRRDLDFGIERVAAENGLVRAFERFTDAKRSLIKEMKYEGADEELIRVVRYMKACDVPVEDRR